MSSDNITTLSTTASQASGNGTITTLATTFVLSHSSTMMTMGSTNTPASSETHITTESMTTTLSEENQTIMLWTIFVIVLVIVLILAMTLCLFALGCHKVRKKRRRRHIHQTNPRQGSLRSVEYSIMSQDKTHLGSSPHYEYVDVLGEDYGDSGEHLTDSTRPQEYLSPNVRGKKHVVPGESTLYDNLEPPPVTKTEPTAANARVAVPPFINIGHQDTGNQPETDTRLSTTNQQAEALCAQETTPVNTEEASGPTAEEAETRSQTQTPEERHQLDIFEDGTMLRNVPMFQDPEIGGSLRVPTPPNIYSSQILATVGADTESTQEDNEQEPVDSGVSVHVPSIHCVDNEVSSKDMNTTQPLQNTCVRRSESLQHSNEPDYMDINLLQNSKDSFDSTDPRPSPEGAAQINQDSLNRSRIDDRKEKEEAVYDEPVIVKHEDIKEHGNLATLFDDPRYTEVILKTQKGEKSELVPLRKNSMIKETLVRPQTLSFEQPLAPHRTLWSSMSQDGTERLLTKKSGLQYSKDDTCLPDESNKLQLQPNLEPLEVQIAVAKKSHNIMKSSIDSLELLDYQDEEMEELDPEIVKCLQRTPESSCSGVLKETQV